MNEKSQEKFAYQDALRVFGGGGKMKSEITNLNVKKEAPLIIFLTTLLLLLGCATEQEVIESAPSQIVVEEQQVIPEEDEETIEAIVPTANISGPELEANALGEIPAPAEITEEPKPCGSFFDAYTRITGGPQDSGDVKESELAALLAARMKEHDVGCALLVGVDVTDFDNTEEIRDSIDYYYTILKLYPNTFTPFLDLDTESSADFTTERLGQILTVAQGKINYKGLGEVSFVDPGPWNNKKFTDTPLPELIEFFGEREMVVAAHIAQGQTADLKSILTQYPDTKILVHGYPDGLKDLLVKHKNLYYAAELEIMLGKGTYSCSISFSDGDVDSAISQYAPLIAAAPDQVLWATNAHSKCHFQPGFYGKLIEFSQKFVEKLPEEHRERFAYGNAERLLKGREI